MQFNIEYEYIFNNNPKTDEQNNDMVCQTSAVGILPWIRTLEDVQFFVHKNLIHEQNEKEEAGMCLLL